MKEIPVTCSQCGHKMTVKMKVDWKKEYQKLKAEYDRLRSKTQPAEKEAVDMLKKMFGMD